MQQSHPFPVIELSGKTGLRQIIGQRLHWRLLALAAQMVIDQIPRGSVYESCQLVSVLQLTLAQGKDHCHQDILDYLARDLPVVSAHHGHNENPLRELCHQFRLR
jgi:hypothetical protein